MSELINRIPGRESVVATLSQIRDTTAQLKARQRTTGRGGQIGYAVSNNNDWDLVETYPATSPTGGYLPAEYRITYTGDGSQKFPIAVPNIDIRVNGTAEANKLKIIPSSGLFDYTDGLGDLMMNTYEMPHETFFGDEQRMAWSYSLMYRGNITLRIKARGWASSNGTFSIQRVA